MLHQLNLEGKDKVEVALERIKDFSFLFKSETEQGYYLAFSGGKDSVVCKKLLDMAGVKYDAHYQITSVDPPELVRFIKTAYPDVKMERNYWKTDGRFHKAGDPLNVLTEIRDRLNALPTIEIVRCKDCKWWEKKEDSTLGYCNAVKHWHFSDHLEIQIYSRYEPDFFCADGERRSENEQT